MSNNVNKSKIKASHWGVVLLLLFYAPVALQVESLHNLFHAHDRAELHTTEQEKDACHRAVYHGEQEKGCEHKTHVKKIDHCSLCAICFALIHISLEKHQDKNFEYPSAYFIHEDVFSAVIQFYSIPARAPPIG